MSRHGDMETTGTGVRDRGLGMEVLDRIGPPVVVGWVAIAIGLVLVVAGYWKVSGTSDVAQQLAYFASTCVGGLFALGAGGVLILSHHYRESARATAEMRRALAYLAREAGLAGAEPLTDRAASWSGAGSAVYRLPGSGTFHLGDCVFVEGRPGASAMTADEAFGAGLEPCQACDSGGGVGRTDRVPRPAEGRRAGQAGAESVKTRSTRRATGDPSVAEARRASAGGTRRRPSRPQ